MKMLHILKPILRNRTGTAGIEFALIIPAVILLFIGGVTMFDLLRNYQRVIEANSVVSDLIARQTSIDKTYFDNVNGVFVNLQDGSKNNKVLRISSITRNGKDYSIAWSKVAGNLSLLENPTLNPKTLPNTLPDIASGDSIIFVESSSKVPLIFNILDSMEFTFQEHTFARPRYANAVAFKN